MNEFLHTLAFGAGATFLGITLTLAGLSALAVHSSPDDNGEGCLGAVLVLFALGVTVALFCLSARLS